MANENKNKKTHAEKKDAREQKKQERKEQKRAERESHGPDWVDPEQPRAPLLAVRDIVDWLLIQYEMPHPMHTNAEVMLMWLEAMDTGLSKGYMRRRLPAVMQLWREEGDSGLVYTREEQEDYLRKTGVDMALPEITISWQQFKQSKDLQREVDEQLTQSLQQTVGEEEQGEDKDE